MRILGKLALTVGALVLLAPTASAQRPAGTGGPGGLGGGPILLFVPNVQEELKLTGEQTRTVPQILQQILSKHREEMMALRDLPQEERTRKQRELTRSMNDEAKKSLSMSAEQAKRFDQISLQQRSIEVFGDPEVQAKLKLSPEQLAQIHDIAMDSRERFMEIANSVGNDREEAMRKIRQLQKDLMAKSQTVMTDEQKASWKELAGEPFEVRFERPRSN
jgi:hypothetical protein